MSLSSFLFERHQAIAYHMSQKLATWRAAYHRMQERQVRRPNPFDSLEPRMLMSSAPVTFTDASGDIVTITLTGPGSMAVAQVGNADATSISLSGTTVKSTLKVTVARAPGVDKSVIPSTTLGTIDLGDGQLGVLSAGSVDFNDQGIIGLADAYIKSIAIRDLNNGADIYLTGGVNNGYMALSVRNVTAFESSVQINMAISTATFADMEGSALISSRINALKVLGVKGDAAHPGNFKADVVLSATTGTVLGSVYVAGTLSNANWIIGGTVGNITAKVALNSTTIDITSGNLGAVSAGDLSNNNWNLTSGRISKFTTAGSMSGSTTAISIGSVYVGGDMSASLTLGSNSIKDTDAVLKSLVVKGVLESSITATHGSIGTISAGYADGLNLDLTNGFISQIKITGFMTDSTIKALRIGTWTVGGNLSNTTATISGTGYSGYAVLNAFYVTGDVSNTYVKATLGGLGTLKAKSLAASTFDFAAGRIGRIAVAGNVSGGYVHLLTTLDTFIAQSIGAWTTGGDVSNVVATLGSSNTILGKQALDGLAVKGTISGTTIKATYGGSGAISANAITASTLDFATGRIASIKSSTSHSGGNIYAMAIGTWNVKTTLNEVTATLATDEKVKNVYALTDLIVGGAITDTLVDAEWGAIRTIRAGAEISGSSFLFDDGRITTLQSGLNHTGGSVEAMSIGTWKVGGNLSSLSATLAKSSSMHNFYAVTDLLVSGAISGVNITSTYGGVRTISAQSIGADASTIDFADGYISSIKTTQGVSNLTLKAESINTWTAGGNLNTVTATLGNASTVGYKALNTLTVNGDLIDTSIVASEGGAGTIKAKSMTGGKLYFANGRITTIDLTGNMETTDTVNDQVRAFSIGTWKVGGYLKNTVAHLGADDAKDYLVIGKLSVGGAMTDVKLTADHDSVNIIQAASITGGSLNFAGTLVYLKTTGDMSGTDVDAQIVKDWVVDGNLTSVVAVVGDDTTDRDGDALTDVIEYLRVGGTINLCRFVADGSLGTIMADRMTNSHLYVGYAFDGVDYVRNSNEEIYYLNITGDGSKTTAFDNNVIKSYTISNMVVNMPNLSDVETNKIIALDVITYPGGNAKTDLYDNLSSQNLPPIINGLAFTWI